MVYTQRYGNDRKTSVYTPGGSTLNLDMSTMMVCHSMGHRFDGSKDLLMTDNYNENNYDAEWSGVNKGFYQDGPIDGTRAIIGDGTDNSLKYFIPPFEILNKNLPSDSNANDGQYTTAFVFRLNSQPEDGSGTGRTLWAYNDANNANFKCHFNFGFDPYVYQSVGYDSGTLYIRRIKVENANINDGNWHTLVHRCLDQSDNSLASHKVYIDGVLQQQGMGSEFTTSTSYNIDRDGAEIMGNDGSNFWDGEIAFIAIDNSLWDEDEAYQFNNAWGLN